MVTVRVVGLIVSVINVALAIINKDTHAATGWSCSALLWMALLCQ